MYKVILKGEVSETAVELTSTEYTILNLAEPLCFLLDAILRPPKSSKVIKITTERVRDEIRSILAKLDDGKLLHKYEYHLDERFHSFDLGWRTGLQSSVRLPHEPGCVFGLEAGVGICELERLRIDPQTGRGVPAGVIDIRDRSLLETDGQGPIQIRRKPIAKDLRQKIAGVGLWVAGQSGMIRAWHAQK